MLSFNDLENDIASVSRDHIQLKALFEEFANNFIRQFPTQFSYIKHVETLINFDDDYFEVAFAGRTLRFKFKSLLVKDDGLKGSIICCRMPSFPQEEPEQLGTVTFDTSGQTNMVEPERQRVLYVKSTISAIHIVLHFMHESMLK
jgi:hypothetical protein